MHCVLCKKFYFPHEMLMLSPPGEPHGAPHLFNIARYMFSIPIFTSGHGGDVPPQIACRKCMELAQHNAETKELLDQKYAPLLEQRAAAKRQLQEAARQKAQAQRQKHEQEVKRRMDHQLARVLTAQRTDHVAVQSRPPMPYSASQHFDPGNIGYHHRSPMPLPTGSQMDIVPRPPSAFHSTHPTFLDENNE